MIKEEWHLDNILETTHETYSKKFLEENISHLEPTKSEIGEETTQPESLLYIMTHFRLLKRNGILKIY